MVLTLSGTTLACGGPPASEVQNEAPQTANPQNQNAIATPEAQLPDGQYPVQQVTYNDAGGEYSLFLIDTSPGVPSNFQTTNLKMARLTDSEVSAGQSNYLKVEKGQPSLHVAEDFQIQYVHNVTETQNNPQTGQQETVVVRQESNFWAPFAGAATGAIAGQALGSILFRPQYYVPPIYQPGGTLVGYGGYGNTYSQAVNRYQERYQAPPSAVRNRQALRTTGRLNAPSANQPGIRPNSSTSRNRASGSGFGSSNLRQSDQSRPSQVERGSGGFGSARPRIRSGRR